MMKTSTNQSIHTTQASPNGGGREWGLKNPTQAQDFLLNFIQCALRILVLERTFQIKAK